MKKIILLLIALMVTTVVSAQITFKESDTYKVYNGVSTDVLASGELSKLIYLDRDYEYNYYVEVEVDSAGDGSAVKCILRGSNNAKTFYSIDTVSWSMTSADTAFSFTSFGTTTSNHWRYLQLYFKGASSANLSIPTTGNPLRIQILKE